MFHANGVTHERLTKRLGLLLLQAELLRRHLVTVRHSNKKCVQNSSSSSDLNNYCYLSPQACEILNSSSALSLSHLLLTSYFSRLASPARNLEGKPMRKTSALGLSLLVLLALLHRFVESPAVRAAVLGESSWRPLRLARCGLPSRSKSMLVYPFKSIVLIDPSPASAVYLGCVATTFLLPNTSDAAIESEIIRRSSRSG